MEEDRSYQGEAEPLNARDCRCVSAGASRTSISLVRIIPTPMPALAVQKCKTGHPSAAGARPYGG